MTLEHTLQTFSPREVQARVRAGETAESIADDTGWPLGKVTRYAEPLLAERAYIAQQAQAVEVRRSGGGATLRESVDSCAPSGEISWDAFRRDDGRWIVTVTVAAEVAEWTYDHSGRNVHPLDDLARALMGAAPLPGAAAAAEDADIIDALNLVAGVPVVRADEGPEPVRPRLVAVPDDEPDDRPHPSPDHPTVVVPTADPDDAPSEPGRPAARRQRARKGRTAAATPSAVAAGPVDTGPDSAPADSAPADSAPDRAAPEPRPAARKPRARKGRASVPSWDEILFGSGNPKDDDPA